MMTGRAEIPGRMGPPLVGETLTFLKNPFRFLEERQRQHGDIFKARLLGRKIVFLAGTEGAEAFYDGDNISREDAHPFTLVDLFGGINMEMYDGQRHFDLKSMALTAFDEVAIAGYLPEMQALIESTLARPAAEGEFSAVAELRRLAIASICRNVMGVAAGPETDAFTRDYGIVLNGLVSLPLPLPLTGYGRARAARDRILGRIRALIEERRRQPANDGLSRILAAKAEDGRTYTDEEALLEVHHIVIAGFVVYALMAEGMLQLAQRPELRERCRLEVEAHAGSGRLTLEGLKALDLTTRVVMEAKRYVPLVPLAFGKAKQSFECRGYQVPKDWTVYLALWLNNRDDRLFAKANEFDPDRFAMERGEQKQHPMAFIPQGAEPPTGHRCLGLDYSTFLGVAFLALLLRGYGWTVPEQDLALNWRKLPPEQRDGLRVRITPRRGI